MAVHQTNLLERGAELMEIDRALAAVRERGRMLLIEGPAGIGKSRLLDEACRRGAGAALRVLRARGGELERELAFGIVQQLFAPPLERAEPGEREALLSGAAVLAAPALGAAVDHGPPVPPGVDPADAAFHGVYWLCANLASRGPLLLAVDDIQWADERSLRWLAHIARRLDELPALLVVACRTGEPGVQGGMLERLAGDAGEPPLRPQPLSPAGTAAVVRGRLGDSTSEELCAACHAATTGNPFLIGELVFELATTGDPGDAEAPRRVAQLGPEGVARAVLLRLARSPEPAVPLAQALSVLGSEGELRHATAVAGLDEADGAAAADALTLACLVTADRPLRFVHPLVRTAIYAELGPARRALMHRAAARLLADEGAAPERVAPHLLECERQADPETVSGLRAAARDAYARGAPEAAVRYLRRALDEPCAARETADVLVELGRAEIRANQPGALEHLGEAVAGAQDPSTRAGALKEMGRALLLTARLDEAAAVWADAIDLTNDRELRLRLQADLAAAEVNLRSAEDAFARLTPLRASLTGATVGERMVLVLLGFCAMQANAPAREALDLVERGLADGQLLAEQSSASLIFWEAVIVLLVTDADELAERALESALVDARARGWASGIAATTCFRAWLELRRGALTQATAEAESSRQIAQLHGFQPTSPIADALLADALRESGDLEGAGQAIAAAGGAGDIPDSGLFQQLLYSRGLLALARGDAEHAFADLIENGRREVALGGVTPAALAWRSHAALAAERLGRHEEALRLTAEELELARAFGTPRPIGVALRGRGLVLGGPDGLELLREAVATLEPCGARLELARALCELGAALRRSNHRVDARDPLRRALDLAHGCRAHALATRAQDELRAAGGRPRRIALNGRDALTPSELRVAQIAAGGRSNRDIAEDLFVTVRTIEFHLSRAYEKLGIASREQLAGALDQARFDLRG
jgi:DNA-binding CsgD family transcriptional regulator